MSIRNIYRCLALLICLIGGAIPGISQRITTVGSWTPYLSYEYAKEIIRDGDVFYVNTRGGFYTWNTVTDEYRSYSPIDGMSDVDATAMHIDSASGYVFLGYDNGTINYFPKPFGNVRYITDIRRSELFTSKRINKFLSRNGMLYIATDFGLVILDIEKAEVRSSVTKVGENSSGTAIVDMDIIRDEIYVCTVGGLYKTSLAQPNITLPSVWERLDGKNGLKAGRAQFITHVGRNIYTVIADSTFQNLIWTGGWIPGPMPSNEDFSYYTVTDSNLYCGYGNFIRVDSTDGVQYLIYTGLTSVSAHVDSEYTLYGDPATSLQMVLAPDSTVELGPDGPQSNIITQMAVGNGQIFIAPRGQAGATSGRLFEPTGFYYFNQQDGWTNYNVEDELSRDSIYLDIARLAYDPNTNTTWFGSWGQGVIEYRDGEIIRNYTSANSGLPGSFTTSSSPETRVSGLAVDDDGNLWICSILADKDLTVMTPEGEFYSYDLPGTNPVGILIDDWNNKWIINNGQGLTVFNENGTFDNTADDDRKLISTVSGNGGLPSGNVYALEKDLNGHIWIGSLEGISVIANPSRVFTNNFSDVSCPVIDGFCLLRDQRVTSIEVDGANRKWIGTENGVYLVNPQGNRLLDHLTVDNSPLFSDEIRDIEVDPVTGELFIATTKGLLSLMGDATEGKENSDELYVFPNPVYDDYEGQVAISCSVRDAEVRITTASGMVVRELEATGGQAVWDGRDAAGNRLAPGVYLAMVTDSDGQNAGIAKFAVVARNP